MRKILRRGWIGLLIFVPAMMVANFALHIVEAGRFDRRAAITQAEQYRGEIIRDGFGVPHIYGQRDADVAFALAYAHAEDDFKTFQQLLPFYRGELGRSVGFEGLAIDFLLGWLDVPATVAARFETDLSAQLRAHLQAYADGLNYYAALHPHEADPRLFPVSAQDLAVGFHVQHLLFYGFEAHVGELFADSPQRELARPPNEAVLSRFIGTAGLPVGSNAFAINARKSDDGSTRLMINSHQPLEGPVAWYEAHLKSEEGWDVHGGLFPGMPFIAKGFNPDIGWGVTVNKPDLVDIYKLELNPENADEYLLDGAYVAFEKRYIWLKLKLFGNLYLPVPRTVLEARHGPAIQTTHGTYAVRFAGSQEIRQPAQWLAMNKARSLPAFKQAMAMQAIVSFNFVYADKQGELYFLHNTRSPERASGWNWKNYLPGTHSDLIWQNQIEFAAMPQFANPSSGYILSTNQDPFKVTAKEDNLNPGDFAPELGLQTRMTNRADRGLQLFASAGAMSAQDFRAVKWDKAYAPQSRAFRFVSKIQNMTFAAGSQAAAGQTLLAAWSGSTSLDDTAAALAVCLLSEEWLAEQAGKAPPPVADVYADCLENLTEHFGRLNPPWAEVNRLRRGDVDLALGGGPDTLRAIYALPDADGRLRAVAGDGLIIHVAWDSEGEQSAEMIHNFGAASSRPKSRHYADQAPLYAAEQMRPVALTRNEVVSGPHRITLLPHAKTD